MLTDEHKAAWMVLSFHQLSQWMRHDSIFQSWNQTRFSSVKAHTFTAINKILGYCQCWENNSSHVLSQWSTVHLRVPQWQLNPTKMFWKELALLQENGHKRIQLGSSIQTMILLIANDPYQIFLGNNNFEVILHALYSPGIAHFWQNRLPKEAFTAAMKLWAVPSLWNMFCRHLLKN